MISPLLRNKAMSAKQLRMLLIFYIVRHCLGLLAFSFLIYSALQVEGPARWVAPVLGVVYVVTAVYNGLKLRQKYQNAIQREQSNLTTDRNERPTNAGA